MGAQTTYALVTPPKDEADERWRDVLFELLRRAHTDAEFRARVEASGAVIENLEAVIARHRGDRMSTTGAVVCTEYWWGFQLEIPHESLATWVIGLTEPADIAAAIGDGTGPSVPFRRRVAAWIANHLVELQSLDTGAGVCVSMTWMAPNIFIPTTIAYADR